MNRNKIIKSVNFGNVQCDIYKNNNDYYMTREQIGTALEYKEPSSSIEVIHRRNRDRLDKFSVTVKLTGTDGKQYDTIVYNRKGIMEICRFSRQPKADGFMDWVWDVMDGLITGKTKLLANPDKQKRLEIYDKNVRNRAAKLYLDLAKTATTEEYKNIMLSYAAKELSGEYIIPLPVSERKTYSATEIGEMFGVSSVKIGRLANQHNLKTNEYGQLYHDKSRYSSKEVDTFRYYDTVIPKLRQLISS